MAMQHPILSFRLSNRQCEAAYTDGCDMAVLAGAGCGKTTTLVARYLHLLVEGLAPEEIVAITFTERAGREMRVRIRERIRGYLATDPADQAAWLERYTALDGAPIGTIHSFCARLLRAHPAEATLDPDFAVLEENRAAALRAEAVERALVAASQVESGLACFAALGGHTELQNVLDVLLARRLDAAQALEAGGADVRALWERARREWLAGILHSAAWEALLTTLAANEPIVPGDILDGYRLQALAALRGARLALRGGDWPGALERLEEGLKKPGGAGSRKNWGERVEEVRVALRGLVDLYKAQVEWAAKADPALDEELAAAWPALREQFQQVLREYEALKRLERAVDFDDLEVGALRLLEGAAEVAGYQRARVRAVLVDEFQDTNERQRRLIEALLGAPAGQARRLFVVGDAKQSIYRFRGADVTVFRDVERRIVEAGGRAVSIDRTYRAHAPLVETLNGLLGAVLGGEEAGCLYRVPFAPLVSQREGPRSGPRAPFVELHLGLADGAEEGRRMAAGALAARLGRLHEDEGIGWGEIACLFRASTNFGIYEEAFEQAGIPYVTVAGTGFLQRPEVRDLLNALRALATPTDDLALAGLLRSPAIGLADADLYRLRWQDGKTKRGLWAALQGDLSDLEPAMQARARRAARIVGELAPQVGRQPVAAILKRFLDLTAYPAILRLCPQTERTGRNVDKLLADAHRSGTVWVGDFLRYVQTLSDSAARESEAPPEAGEAVLLLTVHKAKGLEFPVAVIADAGHADGPRVPDVLLHPEWGLLIRIKRSDDMGERVGVAHGLARQPEGEMQDAEERRLLYVAATRAKEKLLVSGHGKVGKSGLSLAGWLKRLAGALGEEQLTHAEPEPGARIELALWEGRVGCALYRAAEAEVAQEENAAPPAPAAQPMSVKGEAVSLGELAPLAAPYICEAAAEAEAGPETPERVWRVVPRRPRDEGPAWLVGQLVHVGLRLWRSPDDPQLEPFLEAAARAGGLTDGQQIAATMREARRLLRRFREHELFRELDGAAERQHELPYAYGPPGEPGGRMDLLARGADGRWRLVDFKTDELRDAAELERKIEEYKGQLRRYGEAVRQLLGVEPQMLLCFLGYRTGVIVHEVEG